MKSTLLSSLFLPLLLPVRSPAAELRGRLIDAAIESPVAGRLYIQSAEGQWFHAKSVDPAGSAVNYNVERPATKSVEIHTTLSAHPFEATLPPGTYTLTAERGLEYRPATASVTMGDAAANIDLRLVRWANMNAAHWFSGDVFSHRPVSDCPNLVLAEDLNVIFPIHYWTTASGLAPGHGNQNKPGGDPVPELLRGDATHVVWQVNSEVELFTVAGKPHMQGAFWAFGHKRPLTEPVPPMAPAAEQARLQGGLFDTEKPNWPCTFMLAPVARAPLFRLLNNHHWRTAFGSGSWKPVDAPAFMHCEKDAAGNWTERGWTEFGLRSYYALLNCGLKMMPSAGTGSGVHPVPAGFSRTYVHLPDGWNFDKWMDGLRAGRCFVTNGPMLTATFAGKEPGSTFKKMTEGEMEIAGNAYSRTGAVLIEVIQDGEVVAHTIAEAGQSGFTMTVEVTHSGWLAARAWEQTTDGRLRLAHTAPVWCEITDFPAHPKKQEVAWLIQRMEEEIARNRDVLPADATAEYEQALGFYRALEPVAR